MPILPPNFDAAAVAGCENAGNAGAVLLQLSLDVAALILLQPKSLSEVVPVPRNPIANKTSWAKDAPAHYRTGCGTYCPFFIFFPGYFNGMNRFDSAFLVIFKPGSSCQINTGIIAKPGSRLFLTIVYLVGLGPFRPGIISCTFIRRTGMISKLADAVASMTE